MHILKWPQNHVTTNPNNYCKLHGKRGISVKFATLLITTYV